MIIISVTRLIDRLGLKEPLTWAFVHLQYLQIFLYSTVQLQSIQNVPHNFLYVLVHWLTGVWRLEWTKNTENLDTKTLHKYWHYPCGSIKQAIVKPVTLAKYCERIILRYLVQTHATLLHEIFPLSYIPTRSNPGVINIQQIRKNQFGSNPIISLMSLMSRQR